MIKISVAKDIHITDTYRVEFIIEDVVVSADSFTGNDSIKRANDYAEILRMRYAPRYSFSMGPYAAINQACLVRITDLQMKYDMDAVFIGPNTEVRAKRYLDWQKERYEDVYFERVSNEDN